MREDVSAAFDRDPSATSKLEILLTSPGLHAVWWHRISSFFYVKLGWRLVGRLSSQWGRFWTGIEIHPAAKIGPGFFVDHGMGTVVGETAEIGRDVTLYHDVTLGGVMPAVDSDKQREAKRHPTLGDYVIVGAGAQILGPITVHRCARVGGNSVVTKDVPEAATVVGVRAARIEGAARGGVERIGDLALHREWIATLLEQYYDPMYEYQMTKKARRVVFKGDSDTFLEWASEFDQLQT